MQLLLGVNQLVPEGWRKVMYNSRASQPNLRANVNIFRSWRDVHELT